MKTFPLIHKGLIAMVLVLWCTTTAWAQTVRDFDTSAGTPYVSAQCGPNPNAPPPIEIPGGPTGTGNFLRLATTFVVTSNTITFDRTNPGLFSQIVAEFDFRMTPPGAGRADGLGFALLNTAVYDSSGPVCPTLSPFVPEEPNFIGSLGVGFDIHQVSGEINNNHTSIHFDGAVLTQVDATPIDLAMGQWIHAEIVMRLGGGSSNVSVILTPPSGQPVTVIDSFPVPGFDPYEGRVFFGARSGGESADHDLDNIVVQYSVSLDPAIYGQWSDVIDAEIVPIHLNLLPTGKVLYWENGGFGEILVDEIRLWDPVTGTISIPAEPSFDIFCSGHSFLADGKLLVTGGHALVDFVGLSKATIYDPIADSWSALPNMNAGRWYPTNTTLGNGDVLVLGGDISENNPNPLPQVWETQNNAWRDLTDAEDPEPLGTDAGGIYPRTLLAPDGRVFKAGPQQQSWYLNTIGTGAWIQGPSSNYEGDRSYGSAVLYDEGKILIVGGGEFPPTNTAEVIDLNEEMPVWRVVSTMAFARRHLNATLLPDGTVLVTGGTSSPGFNDASDAVHVAELWDPKTETWSTMAGMQAPRAYHSTALLLPDGRVLVGGGGRPAPDSAGHTDRTDFEIYSPPYLFKGPRPTITSAPTEVIYGQTFSIQMPDTTGITNVNLIRLPSVTHAFDQNQRMNRLNFLQVPGGLDVTAPADSNLAPPGHYMLFILNGGGVPSVAQIIQIWNSLHTSVEQKSIAAPDDFSLGQNYPNPFNPTTTIEFDLPKAEFVTLKVYNVLGEEVVKLVSQNLQAGKYSTQLEASNLASGVYLYRLQSESFVQTKKMILVR